MEKRKEEVLKEEEFLPGNEKWGGKVQVLRITQEYPDGAHTFIGKRLVFNNTGRFINLPRAGTEEIVAAILRATEAERACHESLIQELNLDGNRNQGRNGERRREGNHRQNREY